jgi:RNA polymerase sigma factor (sigma-70 family)
METWAPEGSLDGEHSRHVRARPMDEQSFNSRLSRISTVWTLLARSHRAPDPEAAAARLAFIQRYQGAAYRYLLAAVRDPDAADDLFQEFALRFIEGRFCGADPQRGRFRDYLKTTLYHLVVDHQKRRRKRPQSLDAAAIEPRAEPWDAARAEEQFRWSWRDELLARAWAALADRQRHGGQPFYSVLKFRAENAKATSAQMAQWLTGQLRPARPFTESGIRKTLQRARAQFADLLIDEVAESVGSHADDDVEQELIDLELLPYCSSALARRMRHK